jgi:hypothetical protein
MMHSSMVVDAVDLVPQVRANGVFGERTQVWVHGSNLILWATSEELADLAGRLQAASLDLAKAEATR